MKTTIDIPESLYKRAKIRAVETGQTLKQIVINALQRELDPSGSMPAPSVSRWAQRKLLPEYEAAVQAGAFSGGTDSTEIISEDRDAR
jgi:hypothetical protein